MTQPSTPESRPAVPGFASGRVLQRRPEGASWKGILPVACSGPGDLPRADLVPPGNVPVSGPRARVEASGDGHVALSLTGLPPGGPWQLVIRKGDTVIGTSEFWVGDLWLMAGQSNMEGVGLMADAAQPHPMVRNLTMARVWHEAREPLHLMAESPDPVHHGARQLTPDEAETARANALKGSGVGLHFARQMFDLTKVPQGLVSCAHGGTTMEQWNPALKDQGGKSLYGSMMLSMAEVDQPVAGVLWYQGCSDANADMEPLYTDRMKAFVAALRKDLGQPDLPFLTVQIGKEIGRNWQTWAWHSIQEQQRRLPESISGLDVVSASDLEHDDWIHISGKSHRVLATRMVHMARRLVLKADDALPCPQPVEARWVADGISPAIEIRCAHVAGRLTSLGRPLGFTLADREGRETRLAYQVRFEEDRVLMRLTGDDLTGLYVYHGLDCEPVVNTFDSRGLPLPVFGPLPVKGLPPVSAWFRDWQISPAETSLSLADLAFPAPDSRWTRQRFEGWNVINMKEAWARGSERRMFRTAVEFPEDMEVVLEAGGDGALRVRLDGKEIITDLEGCTDLGRVRFSPPLTCRVGRQVIDVAMDNRNGESFGFYLRFRRNDAVPGCRLPSEAPRGE